MFVNLIFMIFSFNSKKLVKFRSNETINLLYEGVILVIPLIFFSLISLKYLITLLFTSFFTSSPKSQYKAASPRFDIFLSCHVILQVIRL